MQRSIRFIGFIITLLFFARGSAQSVFTSDYEARLFEYAFFSDSSAQVDPFGQPFSITDEIKMLESLESMSKLSTRGMVERRKRFLSEERINTNGWISADLSEYWDVNAEISYRSKGLKLHYSLGSKRSYINDTTFGLTYNKLLIPVRSRSRLAYISYDLNENTKVGIGRVPFNWSLIGSSGLMISDNAWPKDGYYLRHENSMLSFEHFSVRLDDLLSNDIRDSLSQLILAKRYLSAHRVVLPINNQFKLSMSEAIVFGGQDKALLFQYLNPANVYFISKQADRWGLEEDRANPIIGFDALYTSKSGKSRIYLQLVVDDIDFLPELTAVYPNRYAAQLKLIHATNNCGVSSFSIKEVSDWMYTSFYTWGNFINYNEFIGNPVNGITELTFNHQIIVDKLLLSTDLTFAAYKDQNQLEQFDHNSDPIRNYKFAAISIIGELALRDNLVVNARLNGSKNLRQFTTSGRLAAGISLWW